MSKDVFEISCDTFDVTSAHRPDTDWIKIDPDGHEHRWYANDVPATTYDPTISYTLPTLDFIVDGRDEDDVAYGHYECKLCGETIRPQYTADTTMQFIPGLRQYKINGQRVTEEEFRSRLPK